MRIKEVEFSLHELEETKKYFEENPNANATPCLKISCCSTNCGDCPLIGLYGDDLIHYMENHIIGGYPR